jgi:MFS family permease
MCLFMAAYFCAGMGYVISATFIVAITNRLPGLEGQGNWAFLAIGLGAAPSCIYWDRIARRTGNFNALILTAVLQIIGILLPILFDGLLPTLLGALLFGGTFMGLVSLVLTMAGRFYPSRPAKMMGKMTLSYGSAQIIGPVVTSWLAKYSGSFAAGLYMAAAMLLVGLVLLVVLKIIEKPDLCHHDKVSSKAGPVAAVLRRVSPGGPGNGCELRDTQ